MAKLTTAQENALKHLNIYKYSQFDVDYKGSDVKPFYKLVEYGFAEYSRNANFAGMPNRFTLTADGMALARELFGTPDPDDSEPATSKRNLSFQEASDLLAEDPTRTDVKLMYANQVRTVTKVTRSIDGFWDVIAGWRYSYDQKGIVDFLWQEVTPAPDDDGKPKLSESVLNGIQQWAEQIASDPEPTVADAPMDTPATVSVSEPVAPKPAIVQLPKMLNQSEYANKLNGNITILFQRVGTVGYQGQQIQRSIVSYQHSVDLRNRKSRRQDAAYMRAVGTPTNVPLSKPLKWQKSQSEEPATEHTKETILQIVSRIQTPLTGGVRRVA